MFYFDQDRVSYIDNSLWNYYKAVDCVDKNFFNIQDIRYQKIDDFTNSESINEKNKIFIEELNKENDYFINLLMHSDFEDGENNESINFIQKKITENAQSTFLWLANLFSQYTFICSYGFERNMVLNKILRIFAYVSVNTYLVCIQDTLLGLINEALNDKNPSVNEAAIMVLEEIRGEKALNLLRIHDFSNSPNEQYVNQVIKELEIECKYISA